jgi:hypothetical protein
MFDSITFRQAWFDVLAVAAGLTVGEWVEVEHDFSPGNNSGGGVAIIYEIVESFSYVRYIIDGRRENFVPFKRITSIPMPFRRETAKLRMRSTANEQQEEGETKHCTSLTQKCSKQRVPHLCQAPGHGSKWRTMNHVECLQYGVAHGFHKKEGWLWKKLLVDGIVPNTQAALRERCYNAYQSPKVFIMAQQQIMPEG